MAAAAAAGPWFFWRPRADEGRPRLRDRGACALGPLPELGAGPGAGAEPTGACGGRGFGPRPGPEDLRSARRLRSRADRASGRGAVLSGRCLVQGRA